MVVAAMFGKEAGLFCPSGTMTNQIAIKCHTRPGDEVICDESSHVYQYEGGGIAVNSGASVKLLTGDRGRITAEQVLSAINPADDDHKARTRLVCLENTSNRGGGSCYDIEEIKKIAEVCKITIFPFTWMAPDYGMQWWQKKKSPNNMAPSFILFLSALARDWMPGR